MTSEHDDRDMRQRGATAVCLERSDPPTGGARANTAEGTAAASGTRPNQRCGKSDNALGEIEGDCRNIKMGKALPNASSSTETDGRRPRHPVQQSA